MSQNVLIARNRAFHWIAQRGHHDRVPLDDRAAAVVVEEGEYVSIPQNRGRPEDAIAAAGLMLTLTVSAPADVSGKWEGTVTSQREDGTTNENSALVILNQKDGTITGTVGGDEADQHPITSGTIEGNKITLLAKHTENGREFRIELTVNDDEMKGTVASGERRAQLVLKRRKQ